MTPTRHASTVKLLLAFSAPLLWFAHFSIVYGLASVCGPPSSLIDAERLFPIITGVSVVALAGLAAIAVVQARSRQEGDAFLARVGLGLTALSTVALAWVYLSLFFVSDCGGEPSIGELGPFTG
jgi:hypothetical protein